MKSYTTRFFFITWPDGIEIQEIEEKFMRHWFDHVELCYRPDEILWRIFKVMGLDPTLNVREKIVISFANEFVWDMDSPSRIAKRVSAKYCRLGNKIAVCLKNFSLTAFKHECARAVIEYFNRSNLRYSLAAQEALADWVDSKLRKGNL